MLGKPRILSLFPNLFMGAQWLSGRVLDSRPKGRGFKPHRRHCVVSLSKTHLSLLSTGSTQEDPSRITERLLSGRKESNQTKTNLFNKFFKT